MRLICRPPYHATRGSVVPHSKSSPADFRNGSNVGRLFGKAAQCLLSPTADIGRMPDANRCPLPIGNPVERRRRPVRPPSADQRSWPEELAALAV